MRRGLHESNYLCDDRINSAWNASTETNDGDDTSGIAFEVRNKVVRRREQVVDHDFVLVILEASIFLHLAGLDAKASPATIYVLVVCLRHDA